MSPRTELVIDIISIAGISAGSFWCGKLFAMGRMVELTTIAGAFVVGAIVTTATLIYQHRKDRA